MNDFQGYKSMLKKYNFFGMYDFFNPLETNYKIIHVM